MNTPIPDTPPDYDRTRVIERPDGFWWQHKDTGEEFGPFPTLLEAMNDMEYNADGELNVGETPQEAEEEIGIAGWIDEETGLPAEGPIPRIEDH